jgi:hypothetical protein
MRERGKKDGRGADRNGEGMGTDLCGNGGRKTKGRVRSKDKDKKEKSTTHCTTQKPIAQPPHQGDAG